MSRNPDGGATKSARSRHCALRRNRWSLVVSMVAWVGGLAAAAEAVHAADDGPRSREEIVELVRGGRAAMPAFHLTATVTTKRVAANGDAPSSAQVVGHTREETVQCQPKAAARIERALDGSRQVVASDGAQHLRYAILRGLGDGPDEVGGSTSRDAAALKVRNERSMADLLMDWPLMDEVLARADGAEPTNGLVAWLSQPEVVIDAEPVVIDGVSCIRAVRGSADGRSRVEYALDPNAGWLPRRHQVFSGDTLVLSREVHEFHAIGSGAFLPVRATERDIRKGLVVEFKVTRDAEGQYRAGILTDATAIAAAPAGAVLSES